MVCIKNFEDYVTRNKCAISLRDFIFVQYFETLQMKTFYVVPFNSFKTTIFPDSVPFINFNIVINMSPRNVYEALLIRRIKLSENKI